MYFLILFKTFHGHSYSKFFHEIIFRDCENLRQIKMPRIAKYKFISWKTTHWKWKMFKKNFVLDIKKITEYKMS